MLSCCEGHGYPVVGVKYSPREIAFRATVAAVAAIASQRIFLIVRHGRGGMGGWMTEGRRV